MKHYQGILLPLLFCFCIGCGTSPEAFVKKMEDPKNGLRVSYKSDKYTYTLQYCPYDYMYLLDTKGKDISKEAFEKRKTDLEGLTYFILTLDHVGTDKKSDRSSPEFGAAYDYYSSYFEYGVELKCGGKTLPCSLFHTEGLYGVESGIKIHLGFENVCSETDSFTLRFINELDNSNPIEMTIAREDIENSPEYKF